MDAEQASVVFAQPSAADRNLLFHGGRDHSRQEALGQEKSEIIHPLKVRVNKQNSSAAKKVTF